MQTLSDLNEIHSHLDRHFALSKSILTTMRLSHLPTGAHATVKRVSSHSGHAGEPNLERLGELGFIPGEPVQLLHRGPGGREPLAVVVGETMFALRWLEADCIEVNTI